MTEQISDRLFYNNEQHYVDGGLAPFGGLKADEVPKFEVNCTACYRGYVATWLIDEDGWLRLARIDASTAIFSIKKVESENLLYSIYKNHESPVAATWVNGELEVGRGEIVGSCGMFESVFAAYRVFHFDAGKLVKVNDYDSDWWRKKNNCDERERELE